MKFAYFSAEPFNAAKTIEAHQYAFRYFGGRPQMLVYDQDKIMVVSENMGDVIFVKEFEEYVQETGFSIYLCKGYDPQTKGRVEKVVDAVKHDFLDGRIYCGIDQLNAACLEWLDGARNEQLNSYTKKKPRDMFRDEYRKLIKVYEKRNTDIVVTTPHNAVIEYLDNHYKLPENAVPNDERVRVEKYDDTLLIYHALTNDLICRFPVPEGTGNVVSLPQVEKVLSIEEEMHAYYADYEEETARKYLSHKTYKTYLHRALEIKEEQIYG